MPVLTAEEFAQQYIRYSGSILRMMQRRGARDFEDIAQKAWLRAWAHRESFDGRSSFFTWVGRIAINALIEEFRRTGREVYGVPDLRQELDHTEERLDAATALRAARKHGDLLQRHYVEGYSYEEIAAERGESYGAVKMRIFQARRRVREKLKAKAATG